MIIVTATLSFETEEDRDRCVVASSAVQKATRDDEPGCLAYCFAADPAEPTHIQVYELWTDADEPRRALRAPELRGDGRGAPHHAAGSSTPTTGCGPPTIAAPCTRPTARSAFDAVRRRRGS